jgi:hypothetical protein
LASAILEHMLVRQQLWMTPCSQLTAVGPSIQPSLQRVSARGSRGWSLRPVWFPCALPLLPYAAEGAGPAAFCTQNALIWFLACRLLPPCHIQLQVLAQQQLMAAARGQRRHHQPTHRCQGMQTTPHSTRSGTCGATDHTLMWIPRCVHTHHHICSNEPYRGDHASHSPIIVHRAVGQ